MKQPRIIEQYLHDITVLEDTEIEAKYYTTGIALPRYPMPAIRTRTFDSLVKLGHSSAENNFPIDIVFENYIKY